MKRGILTGLLVTILFVFVQAIDYPYSKVLSNIVYKRDATDPYVVRDCVIVLFNTNTTTAYYRFFSIDAGGIQRGPFTDPQLFGVLPTKENLATELDFPEFIDYIPYGFQGQIRVESSIPLEAFAYTNQKIRFTQDMTGTDPRLLDPWPIYCCPEPPSGNEWPVAGVWYDVLLNLDKINTTVDGYACVAVPYVDIWEECCEDPVAHPGWNIQVSFQNPNIYPVTVQIKYERREGGVKINSGWLNFVTVPAGQRVYMSGQWVIIPAYANAMMGEHLHAYAHQIIGNNPNCPRQPQHNFLGWAFIKPNGAIVLQAQNGSCDRMPSFCSISYHAGD